MTKNGHRRSIATLFVLLILSCVAHSGEPRFRVLDPTASQSQTFNPQAKQIGDSATILNFVTDGDALYTVDANGSVQRRGSADAEPDVLVQLEFDPACVALSPDASWLACGGSEGVTQLWQASTKQQILLPLSTGERTVALRFSNDESLLAYATHTGAVRIWHLADKKLLQQFRVKAGSVQQLAFSPNNRRLAAGSFTDEIVVQDIGKTSESESTQVRKLNVGSRVTALALFNEDEIVVATTDGWIKLYGLGGKSEPETIARHSRAAWSLVFDATKSRLAAGSWEGRVRVWDTGQWGLVQSVKQHDESITGIALNDEYGLLSASLDGRLLSMTPEVNTIQPLTVIDGRPDAVWVAIRSPNEQQMFVGGHEKRFELWDLKSKKLDVSREGHATTRCAAYSPDGRFLVTGGDDGKILVCDALTGETQRTLLRHPGALSALVFANRGTELISVCDGGVMKLWDFVKGKELKSWHEHKHQIYCAAVSPNEEWLVTGGGDWTTGDRGELLVWNLQERTIEKRLRGHKLAVWSIVFTPDGERFASSDSDGTVRIWNAKSFAQERTLQHSTWVRPLAISPDGGTLAVGRGDGSIRLWDTATWRQVASCNGHESFSFHLQFNRAGQTITSSGNDGTVQTWPLAGIRKDLNSSQR